jgi:hypothetical protein
VARIQAAATSGTDDRASPATTVAESRRYGNFLGMELGFAYESSAIVSDGTEAPSTGDAVIDYVPTGRPGHRAPHVWLERDGKKCSTLDLFGTGFTVLAGARGHPWMDAAGVVGGRLEVPMGASVIGPGGTFQDEPGDWTTQCGVNEDGAVLVRPDGHVAWRSVSSAPDAADVLATALGQILDR